MQWTIHWLKACVWALSHLQLRRSHFQGWDTSTVMDITLMTSLLALLVAMVACGKKGDLRRKNPFPLPYSQNFNITWNKYQTYLIKSTDWTSVDFQLIWFHKHFLLQMTRYWYLAYRIGRNRYSSDFKSILNKNINEEVSRKYIWVGLILILNVIINNNIQRVNIHWMAPWVYKWIPDAQILTFMSCIIIYIDFTYELEHKLFMIEYERTVTLWSQQIIYYKVVYC